MTWVLVLMFHGRSLEVTQVDGIRTFVECDFAGKAAVDALQKDSLRETALVRYVCLAHEKKQ